MDGQIGDQNVNVRAGDEIIISPLTVHGWTAFDEGQTRIIVELRPAHEGFEKWIMMLHDMAADGLTKPDLRPNNIVHAALFLAESDTHLAGLACVVNPVFKAVALFAYKAGVDRKLEEKYYRPRLLSS